MGKESPVGVPISGHSHVAGGHSVTTVSFCLPSCEIHTISMPQPSSLLIIEVGPTGSCPSHTLPLCYSALAYVCGGLSELSPWKLVMVSPAESHSQCALCSLSASVESAVHLLVPSQALCWAFAPSLSELPPPTQAPVLSGGSHFTVCQISCPSTTIMSPILNDKTSISR